MSLHAFVGALVFLTAFADGATRPPILLLLVLAGAFARVAVVLRTPEPLRATLLSSFSGGFAAGSWGTGRFPVPSHTTLRWSLDMEPFHETPRCRAASITSGSNPEARTSACCCSLNVWKSKGTLLGVLTSPPTRAPAKALPATR